MSGVSVPWIFSLPKANINFWKKDSCPLASKSALYSCFIHSCIASFLVVNCRVMSCIVVSCRVLSYRVVTCLVVYYVWSFLVLSRLVVSCLVLSCRIVSCRGVSCHVVSWRILSCRVLSFRVVSCRVVPRRIVSYCVEQLLSTSTNSVGVALNKVCIACWIIDLVSLPKHTIVYRPVTRILQGEGGAFWLEVDLAITVMIKQSDWDYRVNKVAKDLVTCIQSLLSAQSRGRRYHPRKILKNIDAIVAFWIHS